MPPDPAMYASTPQLECDALEPQPAHPSPAAGRQLEAAARDPRMGRPASQADQGASVGALLQGEAGASQDPHLGACPPAVQGASCLVRWRYTDPQRRDGACPRPCGRRQRGPDPRPECCSQDPGHREERAPAPLSSASLVPAASAWSQVSAAVPSGQDHLHPPPGTYTSMIPQGSCSRERFGVEALSPGPVFRGS